MGDRANVAIQGPNGRVYLYTHWRGMELPEIVRRALARRQRWEDPSYLARIVFCQMVRDEVDGVTGYGISLKPANDRQHPILVLDTDKKEVRVEPGSEAGISFEEYIHAACRAWPTLKS